jgi:importin subunit beta-1
LPVQARQLAGLMIKNALQAKDEELQTEKHGRWEALDPPVRNNIKQALLSALRSAEAGVHHISAVAAAEVAAFELPYNEWPEFLPALLGNVTSPQFPDPVKVATLECLGYTCERLAFLDGPEIGDATTDAMLTAIVDGIQPSRPDKLRLAAATALKNSLLFCQKNMKKKKERDTIMTAICEATRSPDLGVRAVAYECIFHIAVLYYEKLPDYMATLYELTTETIRNDQEDVAKAAIEFWSSLSEVEHELLDEAAELADRGLPVERQCMQYVAAALVHLAPILTETLAKQEEDADEDTYNLHMAGHTCLSLISETVKDAVVPVIMPFVNQNIQNKSWRLRDAAIMAFTSILVGPSAEMIGPYVQSSAPVLLGLFSDPHVMVQATAVDCVSQICLLHVRFCPTDMFPHFLRALIARCGEGPPRVASQACTAIHNLALAFAEEASQQQETNALSPFMPNLLQTLLQVYDRQDADESKLREGAMEAISVLIANSAVDVKPLLTQLIQPIAERFERTFAMQDFDPTETDRKEQDFDPLQGFLCAVIQVQLFQKLDKATILPYVDKTMELLIRVLQAKNADCHEDCFSTISAVADLLEGDFAVSNIPCSLLEHFVVWKASRSDFSCLYRNTCQICNHS